MPYVILLPDHESPRDLLRTTRLKGYPTEFTSLREAREAVRRTWRGDGSGRINVLVETGLGWEVQIPAYDNPEGHWIRLTIPSFDRNLAEDYAEGELGAKRGWLEVIGESKSLATSAGKPLRGPRKRW